MDPNTLLELPKEAAAAMAYDAAVLLPRALAALLVGSLLAWRPWRIWMRMSPVKREMAQAQALLCVAGCVMVGVIGDNVARAFGLVGLGGLIRFRAALKDPRDGAIFFLLIGLGMAAGMGAYALLATGGLFLALLLVVLDHFSPRSEQKAAAVRLFVRCEHPFEAEQVLRPAFADAQVQVRELTANPVDSTLELVVDEPTPGAAMGVVARAPLQTRSVRCESLKPGR